MKRKLLILLFIMIIICTGCTNNDNINYEVETKDISNAQFTALASQKFTGKEITPSPVLVMDGNVLVEGSDYTVSYLNNVNSGEATVVIAGTGNYTGSNHSYFKIVKSTVPDAVITCVERDYNGNSQEIAYCSGGTISGSNQTDAGTYTVTCKADQDHKNAKEKKCTINKFDINHTKISVIADQEYTGKKLTPAVEITHNDELLVIDQDYTLEYSNNVNPGRATIVIKGIGNYSEMATIYFTITSQQSSSSKKQSPAVITCINKVYDGTSQTIATCSGGTVHNAVQTESGKYKITCKGDETHTDATSQTCNIVAENINNATVGTISNKSYTGNEITPLPTVTLNGKLLSRDKDYKLSYLNNKEIGTAAIVVTGIGNFGGTKKTTFEIVDEDAPKAKAIITCANKVYNGTSQTIATCSGGTISNAIQKDVGNYSVSCKGDSTHTDAENKTCSVTRASIAKVVVGIIASQTYTGNEIKPTPTVTLNGRILKKDTDYTIAYKNNIEIGTATLVVTGKNNYSGSVTASFKIADTTSPKTAAVITCANKEYNGSSQTIATCSGGEISNAKQTNVGTYKVTCKGDNTHTDAESKTCEITKAKLSDAVINTISAQTYTGNEIKPTPTVTLNGRTLKKDTDYTVSYRNNTNAGTATLSITGKGNYSESKETSFTINKAIDAIKISIKQSDYTGKEVKASAESKSGDDVTLVYYDSDSCKSTSSLGAAPVQAGTYYAIGKTPGNINYSEGTSECSPAVIINKKTDKLSLTEVKTVTYSGSTIKANVKSDAGLAVTVTYFIDETCSTMTAASSNTAAGSAPKNAGTYYVKATSAGTDSCDGASLKCIKGLIINKVNIANATISDVANQKYTGSEIKPAITLTMNNKTLTEGTNYILSYSNNTTVGNASITVKGKGNYTGSKNVPFKITNDKTKAVISCTNKEYNGEQQEIATCSGGTISNERQTNVGEYTISCAGDSNHSAADNKKCKITRASLKAASITTAAQTYTGESLKPDPVVKVNGKTLTKGTDYTVSYRSNTNVGTASITVTGTGNYTESKDSTFKINKAEDIISITKVGKSAYTGEAVYPTVTTSSKSTPKLIYYSDNLCTTQTTKSNAVKAGGAPKKPNTYFVTGTTEESENYKAGKLECTKAVVISKLTNNISVTPKNYVYNGEGKSASAEALSKKPVTFKYYIDDTCQTQTTTDNAVKVGGAPKSVEEYYVTSLAEGNDIYEDGSLGCTYAVKIDKSKDTISVAEKKVTYSAEEKAISANVSRLSTGKVTVTYYKDENCKKKTNTKNANSDGGAPKVAGEYYIMASCPGDNNYKKSSLDCTRAVIIEPASDTFKVKVKTVNYSDEVKKGISANVTSASGSEIKTTYYTDDTCETLTTAKNAVKKGGAPKVPGTYYIKATSAGNDNYKKTTSKCTRAVVINYLITYYGDTTIETGISEGVILSPSKTTPVRTTVTLPLKANTEYVLSFDAKNSGETNKFRVDFSPFSLKLEKIFETTNKYQHFVWDGITSKKTAISGATIRFLDNVEDTDPKSIIVKNIMLGTVKKVNITPGNKIESLPKPKRVGYTFTGWFTESGVKVDTKTEIKSNLKLYPRFTKNERKMRVVTTNYEYTLFDTSVMDFGAKRDGSEDATRAFNLAMKRASNCLQGGATICGELANGVVYVPKGKYLIKGQLIVPDYVTLVGQLPSSVPSKIKAGKQTLSMGDDMNTSVLMLKYGKDNTAQELSALKVGIQSQVKNLVFWYPDQKITAEGTYIKYPPTILQTGVEGMTLENLLFMNSFIGIDAARSGWNKSIQFIKDIYGTPLARGLYNDGNLDTIKVENLDFSPKYWANSGLSGKPTSSNLYSFLKAEQAEAILFERVDWYMLANIKIDGYYYGLRLGKSTQSKAEKSPTAEGELYDAEIINSYYPIYSESSKHTAITKATLQAKGGNEATAVYVAGNSDVSLNSCTISSEGTNAIVNKSEKAMSLVNSTVTKKIVMSNGKNHGLALASNTLNGTGYESYNHTNPTVPTPPPLNYSSKRTMKPGTDKVIALKPVSGKDLSDLLKQAFKDLGSDGGIIFLSSNSFTMNNPVTVPSKVEIRGAVTSAHNSGGTTINTKYFKGPLFILKANSGLNGLKIQYPQIENPYDAKWKEYNTKADYTKTFAIRGNGSNIYVRNVTILNAWSGIDLKSERCNNHFIEHIWGVFLNTGIAVGSNSENGIIRDNHFTINVMTKTKETPYTLNLKYMIENEVAYSIQESKNEILLNNFVFGANTGFFTANSTNLNIIGAGADSSNVGLKLRGTITNGNFVNMLLVTKVKKIYERDITINGEDVHITVEPDVDTEENNYIKSDSSFKGHANIINSVVWGNNKSTAYKFYGNGTIVLSGGIMTNGNDDNKKPFIRNEVSSLMVAGTIFGVNGNQEFNNTKSGGKANYICPVCYDTTCNIKKSNNPNTYLKDSCVVRPK